MLIAHHTPLSPRLVDESIMAPGILRALNIIPTIDGGTVFPIPLKAPDVVISIHINSCDNPNIFRYETPYLIASSS